MTQQSLSQPLAPTSARTAVGTDWFLRTRRRILFADAIALSVAVATTHLMWIGPQSRLSNPIPGRIVTPPVPYLVLTALLGLAWFAWLGASSSRRRQILGSGPDEFKLVLSSSLWLFGIFTAVCFLAKIDVARGYVALAFPLGVALLLLGRWLVRRWLFDARKDGSMCSLVLLVGSPQETTDIANRLGAYPQAGIQVGGRLLCHDGERADIRDVIATARDLDAQAVVVCQSAQFTHTELNDVRWALEDIGADLVMAASISGVCGRRVSTRQVDGTPLLYVASASFDGGMRILKGFVDRVLSSAGLILLSPLIIGLAIAVKSTSPGPAFYRQERVGRDGTTFSIWKFRSMRTGSDAELMRLLAEQGTDGEPLFKLKCDDRITPLGKVMRKWSLDEIPQLFNVALGDMSLVGPRPQRPAEVALYTGAASRRLKAKPGITGLWQVSGRSDLAWSEAVKLDLYYVENWSPTLDMVLLLRTIKVVLTGKGAC